MSGEEIEIERLRAALKAIDDVAVAHVRGAMGIAQEIARAALDGKPIPSWRSGGDWRPIPGHDGYEVSRQGDVRRRVDRILKQTSTGKYGHKLVTIYSPDGKMLRTSVHRLVALAFLGPPPPGKPYALHRNGRAWESSPENLYWGDHDDNTADRIRHASLEKRGKDGEGSHDAI